MDSTRPLVAVIHANPGTIKPMEQAFADDFPAADLWHLVDDRLVKDADRAGGLTPELAGRMRTLIQYALNGGADAVQLACSMYGPVTTQVPAAVPILAADQAMFDRVVELAPRHVVVLASLAPAAHDSEQRLRDLFEQAGLAPVVESVVVEGAAAAAAADDAHTLSRLLVEAAASLEDSVDVIAFAQYSLAAAADAVAHAVSATVVTGPHLAASTLAHRLAHRPAHRPAHRLTRRLDDRGMSS
jgi:hypothetical protein